MKVYHGSYVEICEIDLSKSEPNRDFGRGFYVTNILEQAEFWAKRKGRRHGTKGFVTEYIFLKNAFTEYNLNVLQFDAYSEQWLDFVVANRLNDSPVNIHDYDIVEGPVANDDIVTRIVFYIEGGVSKADFLEELKFKRSASHQIALCTKRSLQMIRKSFKRIDLNKMTIDDAILQSLVADFNMSDEQAVDIYFHSETYRKLIDATSGLCLKSWKDVYEMLKKELPFGN